MFKASFSSIPSIPSRIWQRQAWKRSG